ncbi:uncharacterized protein EV422DRAFT_548332 [Fimicolochytrium jonesii]|uniref:uncharacterized protein n=1 Tax=Fimicolochytrium jonesii TaxID=1396493 RepID=UPI0022FE57E5|nr:uncharacterized protein EV422DRAFT_548332 [Fimicolochytrium jonesii]KAI8815770.1 hypothetical protein EV422DRAFT_548332 [Fimicolochytrium jonesii]
MTIGNFDWYPWARYQGIGAAFFILTGGVISLFYPSKILAAVNIVIGLLIIAWDYPLHPFTLLGPLSTNMYIRFAGHLLAIAPTVFQAPTTTGGLCMLFAALCCLRAAINGEDLTPKKSARGAPRGGAGKDMTAIKVPEN